eukprot:UN07604
MAERNKTWSRQTIVQKLKKFLQNSEEIHLCIIVRQRTIVIKSADIELSHNQRSMKILGEAILYLSKMNIYDRIIHIKSGGESPIKFDWMSPLLSDEFTSLIAMQPAPNQLPDDRDTEFDDRIKFERNYNVLCDMIANDKIIQVSFRGAH